MRNRTLPLLRAVGAAFVAAPLLWTALGCNAPGTTTRSSNAIKEGMLHPNNSKDINDVPAAQREMVRAIVESQKKGQAPDIHKKAPAKK